jgi:hypothetical protein
MSRTNAVVAYQDLDRSQAFLGIRHRVRTTLDSSQISRYRFQPDFSQVLLASCNTHHPCAARGE